MLLKNEYKEVNNNNNDDFSQKGLNNIPILNFRTNKTKLLIKLNIKFLKIYL